ncbi:NMDA receptor-regulated protein 1-domain-containing protein [Limtongia smithiae]|uniref:NMDA receptor-regulated protein 1-domain-containing protein n=1 Tax=Limtongia smithiae TaxID=1125753 RepID=UPI0034CD70C5
MSRASRPEIPPNRLLPIKEANAFHEILKLYETRQYKKALKLADAILKKYPDHGETLAMKGLILCFSDKRDEGRELIKTGLRNDLTSFICWHVFGLYYRSEHNFEEASKCYVNALKYDPENQNILRDLGLLQMQLRNYEGLVISRKSILEQKPTVRQNWTGLAVGYHLQHKYDMAENVLQKYEESMESPPEKDDIEHSELLLYKNMIIYQSGDVARALTDLDAVADKVLDKLSVLEYRAQYLQDLGRRDEAVKAYRKLLNRNADCLAYYEGLEKALGVMDNVEKRKLLYESLAKQYKRSDLARTIPLSFLQGEDFKAAIKTYLSGYLQRGVPSAFVNIKPLYADAAKATAIEEVVLGLLEDSSGEGSTPTTYVWTLHYLAQHFSKVGKHETALEYIDKAIAHTPTLVEAHMVKAKILKRKGDLLGASDAMTVARELDLQDRYVNTKAAKYLLRANKGDDAIAVVSLFTKNDVPGKGVGDLHDMQAIWFLTEQGEMFERQGKIGLALKRFGAVKKVLDDWYKDQFDFHQYSTRRGAMRVYVEMLRWEDGLYAEPFYLRAAGDAIKLLLSLYDVPKSARIAAEYAGMSEEDRKRAQKKAKRDRAKENKKGESEKVYATDEDPLGKTLENSATPLEDALVYWKPIEASEMRLRGVGQEEKFKEEEWWRWGEEIRTKLEEKKKAKVKAPEAVTA